MAFGKRIKFFRNRKGMKQKELGELLGFLGKTSDVRVAQYETEAKLLLLHTFSVSEKV